VTGTKNEHTIIEKRHVRLLGHFVKKLFDFHDKNLSRQSEMFAECSTA
jgi:hypothetical protein